MESAIATTTAARDYRTGLIHGVLASLTWGSVPLYWRQARAVPAPELVAHRMIWTTVFSLIVIALVGSRHEFLSAWRKPRVILRLASCAVLMTINAALYIWAVVNDHVLDASLGYFLNPLVSVTLGLVLFKERLTGWQWLAMALATAAVLNLTVRVGAFPWIALTLASCFATYAALRKSVPVSSLVGVSVETALTAPFALAYILSLVWSKQATFLTLGWTTDAIMMGSGIVSAAPMLWFASAARRLPLSTIGMLQYLGPSCSFLLAVFVFSEPIDAPRFASFGLIWLSLFIFTRGRKMA